MRLRVRNQLGRLALRAVDLVLVVVVHVDLRLLQLDRRLLH